MHNITRIHLRILGLNPSIFYPWNWFYKFWIGDQWSYISLINRYLSLYCVLLLPREILSFKWKFTLRKWANGSSPNLSISFQERTSFSHPKLSWLLDFCGYNVKRESKGFFHLKEDKRDLGRMWHCNWEQKWSTSWN